MGQSSTRCCSPSWLNLPGVLTSSPETSIHIQGLEVDAKTTQAVDENKIKRISIDDFVEMGELGKGGFGKVLLVQHKQSKNAFALKKINKSLLKKINLEFMVKTILNERRILLSASNPFIVKLHHAFQDDKQLYFVMEFVRGGTIASYLNKSGIFSEEVVRFVLAEILLALKYLHENLRIIYRDLKAENVLIDSDGHIKLADFGLSTSEINSWSGECSDLVWYSGVHCTRNLS
jgi:serine/threonine protein kinase